MSHVDYLWIIVMWCLYKLFGLSFWRHPFTAEDPLVNKWCNAIFFVQISFNEEINPSACWIAIAWIIFLQIFVFGRIVPLESHFKTPKYINM